MSDSKNDNGKNADGKNVGWQKCPIAKMLIAKILPNGKNADGKNVRIRWTRGVSRRVNPLSPPRAKNDL